MSNSEEVIADQEQGPHPPPGWQPGDREQVAVVSFSHTIQHAYVAVLGVVYPFALVEFHTSYAVLGVILGAAGVVGGLLQGLASAFKRYSARVMLGSQNLGMALASVLGALSPGIGLFAVFRIFGTLASWPQHPVGSAHLTERVPHRRGLVLAAHTTGGNLGTLIAPLAASAVIAAYSWRWALGATGAVMALASIITWTRVRSAGDGQGHGQAIELPSRSLPNAVRAEGGLPITLRAALRRRKAVAVLVAGMLSGAGRGLGVLTTYVPAYLRDGLHESALTVGTLVTVVSIGAVLGPMAGGHISDRIGRRPVLFALYGCGALALAAFVLVGSNVLAIGFIGLLVGALSYSEQPIRQALFSDAMEGVPARAAFGAYFAISQSVGALWITLIGFLITDVGYHSAFFVMAGSFVAAGTVIAVFARDRRDPTAMEMTATPV